MGYLSVQHPRTGKISSNRSYRSRFVSCCISVLVVGSCLCSFFHINTGIAASQVTQSNEELAHHRRLQQISGRLATENSPIRLIVYSAGAMSQDPHASAIARKQQHAIIQASKIYSRSIQIVSVNYMLSQSDQSSFVKENCGEESYARISDLQKTKPHWAVAVFQWCALTKETREDSSSNAVLFLDPGSPIVLNNQYSNLVSYLSDHVIRNSKEKTLPSIAVLATDSIPPNLGVLISKNTLENIHGSFLLLRNTQLNHDLSKRMLDLVISTDVRFEALETNPLLLSQTLHSLIGKQKDFWYFMQLQCRMEAPRRLMNSSSTELIQQNLPYISCPPSAGYCCSVQDKNGLVPITVLISRHPILPYQILDPSKIGEPHNYQTVKDTATSIVADDELPYISTVTESVNPKPKDFRDTPTFFEILAGKHCLPSGEDCSRCLREKRGGNCEICGSLCKCYCNALCSLENRPQPRHVAKKLTVTPPLYKRDPTRLIPRIVHQTWFEELSETRYPNMSRLKQSWALSGWEYKFYTDADAGDFLEMHFPPEVKEAYDVLIPGAFKADLFRYCVLLIYGGVYADVDIQLETSLDFAIAPDVGFMVPVDEPGKPVHHQMCLWNGFIAAAPGHPFLAKAIETIVNQVRNRFTSVDVDETFCEYNEDKDKTKKPELSVLHAYDTLFTAGPCLLGSSINRVLGRSGQTSFQPGEIKDIWDFKNRGNTKQGTSFVKGIPFGASAEHYNQARIPGRIVILHQNKWDMGSHRFTFVEENLVICATDMPNSDDRALQSSSEEVAEDGEIKENNPPPEHYSKAHAKTGVYGLQNLYSNRDIAHEDIQIFVDATEYSKTFINPSSLVS